MRHFRRFLGSRSGASAIEFALVAGPLFLIMLGTIEFGRAIWSRHVIQEVAIAGARCVALPEPACTASGKYDQAVSSAHILAEANARGVSLASPQLVIDRNTDCFGASAFSSVTISYRFNTALPGFLIALANGSDMQANSCFPMQGS